MRRGVLAGLGLAVAAGLYLAFYPVPIEPLVWEAPKNPGYTGPFSRNERLASAELLGLPAQLHGPEDVAVDSSGRLYASTEEGKIVRFEVDRTHPAVWATTGGRPLGLDFDGAGNLLVADAVRGLLSISPQGEVKVLATEADGVPIRFADDVDCAADGRVFFSDATARFAPSEWGGTMAASELDLIEHGRTGRLLVWDPTTRKATTVLSGISFANGVAVSPDQLFVLVNETGEYRVRRVWLDGPERGKSDVLVSELPGFPDNISAGDGRFWIGLVSPRDRSLDALSGSRALRKAAWRLPPSLRPAAKNYGHVIAISPDGRVIQDLQDPGARIPLTTGIVETQNELFVTSLGSSFVGRLAK